MDKNSQPYKSNSAIGSGWVSAHQIQREGIRERAREMACERWARDKQALGAGQRHKQKKTAAEIQTASQIEAATLLDWVMNAWLRKKEHE